MSAFCSGVIIHPYYVLTTALCVEEGKLFTITAGATEIYGDDSSRVLVQSLEKYIHPNHWDTVPKDNIALLKLSEELPFSKYISAALIPFNHDYPNETAWVSGWGSNSNDSSTSPELVYAETRVILNENCREVFGPGLVEDTVICARGNPGTGACYGDQGGPLYVEVTENSPFLVIGLLSLYDYHSGCGVSPDVYTRISKYMDWIKDNIKL